MTYQPGDVFQIMPEHGRAGWIGAFVLATEIKSWGIQGFVHDITTHEVHAEIFIRLEWKDIEFIGKAKAVPQDLEEKNNESIR